MPRERVDWCDVLSELPKTGCSGSVCLRLLLALVGLAAAGCAVLSESPRAACESREAEMISALAEIEAAHPELAGDGFEVQGVDRDTRSESRAACEVGVAFAPRGGRVAGIRSLVVERYLDPAVAVQARDYESEYYGYRPVDVADGRGYVDGYRGPANHPDQWPSFSGRYSLDCIVVRIQWHNSLVGYGAGEPEDRFRFIEGLFGSVSDALC